MLINVKTVLNELIGRRLLEIVPNRTKLAQPFNDVLDQVVAIESILDARIEGRRRRAFFVVTAHVRIAVRPALSQSMD